MTASVVATLQRIGVRAGTQMILDEVDLSINGGETLLVLGESGSGKSTLINVIGDCVPFSGVVVRQACVSMRTTSISYDTFATFSDLRAGDVIEMYSHIRSAPVNRAMLQLFRLDEIERQRFRVLSAGERKRLALYVALFFDPVLAVLDEPTEGLDPMQRRAFWRVVGERAGATVLATHLWQEALSSHDRICLLAGGRMLGEARPLADWMATVPYRGRFYWAQLEGADEIEGGESFATVSAHGHASVYYADDGERDAALKVAKRNAAGYSESLISLEDVYLLLKTGVVENGR